MPKNFKIMAGAFQVLMIFAYLGFTKYSDNATPEIKGDDKEAAIALGESQITAVYPVFMDIHVMIFIGFGYLMTFLKKYGFGAVSINYMIAAVAFEWGIIIEGIMITIFEDRFGDAIELDVGHMFSGDFAAATVLITFGGLLGKVSPTQLLFVCIVELVFYALNAQILLSSLGIADIGGTMVIHMFGAYFGLACSWMCSPKASFTSEKNGSVVTSDLFSMIGAVFLFIFWPSFVGALATGNARNRAMLNTTLCIVSSTVTAFFASQLLRKGKFDMVDVQNATLAGGVTIGAIADMALSPAIAICVGVVAGGVSCYGYVKVQPWLEEKWGLHDTCGINNLHGMPSIAGGIFSIFGALNANTDNYGSKEGIAVVFGAMIEDDKTATEQALAQLGGVIVTLVIAIGAGLVTGWIIQYDIFEPIKADSHLFEDASAFGVPDEYVCGVSNDLESGDETSPSGHAFEMSSTKKSPPGSPLGNKALTTTSNIL